MRWRYHPDSGKRTLHDTSRNEHWDWVGEIIHPTTPMEGQPRLKWKARLVRDWRRLEIMSFDTLEEAQAWLIAVYKLEDRQ